MGVTPRTVMYLPSPGVAGQAIGDITSNKDMHADYQEARTGRPKCVNFMIVAAE